jgi:hypothetical protein
VNIFGALFLAGFVLDYLPDSIHWRYLAVMLGLGLLFVLLWIRTKDILIISILSIPLFIKIYILTKQLAAWRYVILGFFLLGTGAIVSLFKRSAAKNVE